MTFFETVGQARVFLLLLYAGFLSGALYDGARGLRRVLPKFLRFLPDMLGACSRRRPARWRWRLGAREGSGFTRCWGCAAAREYIAWESAGPGCIYCDSLKNKSPKAWKSMRSDNIRKQRRLWAH